MENPKFCINCKHSRLIKSISPLYGAACFVNVLKCTRNSKTEVVYGLKLEPYLDCIAERENALRLEQERCGYQGIYWEAK